jgi:hypothetical protein
MSTIERTEEINRHRHAFWAPRPRLLPPPSLVCSVRPVHNPARQT